MNAGKLELIRDPETRRLIQAAYAAHETWRYQIELLATPMRELARELSPQFRQLEADADGRAIGAIRATREVLR